MRRLRMTVVVLGVVLARGPAALADASPTPASTPSSSRTPAPAAGTPAPVASSPPPAPGAGTPAPASSPPPAPVSAPSPTPAFAPTPARAGLAVVALAGVADAAWPLAQSVYADPSLRPGAVDDAHARVLCGEVPAPTAAPELRDLSDTVAAVRGDDAPTRALLDGIARRFALRAVVVVRSDAGHPTARLYLADTGAFDAAAYTPDNPAGPSPTWTATARSLDRLFGSSTPAPTPEAAADIPAGGPPMSAPTLATREAPRNEAPANGPHPFYESVWFWGALGAAALAGGAAYFATRDSGPSTIHLEVQVPH